MQPGRLRLLKVMTERPRSGPCASSKRPRRCATTGSPSMAPTELPQCGQKAWLDRSLDRQMADASCGPVQRTSSSPPQHAPKRPVCWRHRTLEQVCGCSRGACLEMNSAAPTAIGLELGPDLKTTHIEQSHPAWPGRHAPFSLTHDREYGLTRAQGSRPSLPAAAGDGLRPAARRTSARRLPSAGRAQPPPKRLKHEPIS